MTVGASAMSGSLARTGQRVTHTFQNQFQEILARIRTGFYDSLRHRRRTPGGEPQGEKFVALTADAFQSTVDWRKEARCRDTDPGLFFPVGTTGLAIEQIDAAKAVCTECTCRDSCLEFALSTNQDTGVWGGTSEEERRVIRRHRRQQRAAATG